MLRGYEKGGLKRDVKKGEVKMGGGVGGGDLIYWISGSVDQWISGSVDQWISGSVDQVK